MHHDTRYLIYTEDLNRPDVERHIARYLGGGTLHSGARGIWGKTREDSLIIEIIGSDLAKIRRLAQWIKRHNHQEAVLVTAQPVDSILV